MATTLLSEHVLLLARICVADPHSFVDLVYSFASLQGVSGESVMNDLLDQWWLKVIYLLNKARRDRSHVEVFISSLIACLNHAKESCWPWALRVLYPQGMLPYLRNCHTKYSTSGWTALAKFGKR